MKEEKLINTSTDTATEDINVLITDATEEAMIQSPIVEVTLDEVQPTEITVEAEISAELSVEQNEEVEVEIDETQPTTIIIEEGVGSTEIKISADHSPYLPNQHTIGAITGLREELDEIKKLKTIYSDKKNCATYCMWEDENPSQENREGYFVSIHHDDNKIRICSATEDEFGVTVNNAGFIGNQNAESLRSNAYGLVVSSGVVGVRCETDVLQGDYVASNNYGLAKKTDGTYGYLVTAISDIEGVRYAIISLTMPTTQMQKFSEITQDVQDRMEEAEINIATAISVANAAYNKAQNTEESVKNNNESVGNHLENVIIKVDSMTDIVNDLNISMDQISKDAIEAKHIANTAVATSENIRQEANEVANEANKNVEALMFEVAPITTWRDPDTGNVGASYLVEHMKNGLATKTEIEAVETSTEYNKMAISKNAEGIENLMSSIDKYSVGEWSQAYGLTWEQAKSILKKDMLYIPTVEHDEAYTNYPVAGNKQEFTKGYYYIWNGSIWIESESPLVYFSAEYVEPSKQCQYWYRDTNEGLIVGDITYEAQSLYIQLDNKWQKVNILSGNVTNRATSTFIQTATEIAGNVTNASGWLAHMGIRVTEDGSFVDSMASTVTRTDYTIANNQIYASTDDILGPIIQQYYAVGIAAPYDIYTWDGEKFNIEPLFYDGVYVMKPNTASIIAAANKYGETFIALNADRINFDGVVTFTQDDAGITTIKGGGIRSGYIASNNFLQIGDVVERGTLLNLNDGTISTSGFHLDEYGNVDMIGRIAATSGYIGHGRYGFVINRDGNWVYEGELEPGDYYYFRLDDVNYYFIAPDDINEEDILTFKNWSLKYGEQDIDYDTRENIPSGTHRIELVNNHYYIGNNQDSLWGTGGDQEGIYLAPDGIGLGNGRFVVDSSGNVITSGDITMRSNDTDVLTISNGGIKLNGAITWGTDIALVRVLYARTELAPPSKAYDRYEDEDSGDAVWHKKYNAAKDAYISYSYDGGATWNDVMRIRGEDGQNGSDGKNADLSEYPWITQTYIDFNKVTSPSIQGNFVIGGNVYGGAFWDLGENAYLQVGTSEGNYGDLSLYRKNDGMIFSIRDQIGAITFHAMCLHDTDYYSYSFLSTTGTETQPRGVWNFSDAEVTGIKITFG